MTVTIDAMKRRVFDVQQGRKKEAVTAMRKKLERQGGKASNITAVTSDMSKSYLPGVKENFPKAEQIIDKFHVKKVLIDVFPSLSGFAAPGEIPACAASPILDQPCVRKAEV